ncbi:molybdopterin-dependent oxidoreductase [Rhodococcus sp. HNM0569]|uniref:molybdopterin-dependent oxidoreductase n=1 Tax=Rhodococcus sp. HNM0569 TaxID=2716340 RepID=UPI00146ED2C1|nr:molybdopterin-dependent oxidoreductase [Rhodococcus sp. HNM0569]NLU82464.1 molybdopterin-dependent oxidoreductase [Rhodococcus sp. HNM0569]
MATGSGPTRDDLPAPGARITPNASADFRRELDKRHYDAVDDSWAGSVPAQYGVAPRIRIGRSKWFNLLWLLPIGFVLLIISVAVAKGLRDVPAVTQFMEDHPGTITPQGAEDHAGFPAWLGWQHFFNMLLMIPIIRSGVTIIADHPRFYWTRHSTPGKDWFRVQKPVPSDPLWTAKQDSITLPDGIGLPGRRHSIGLARWWHLGINTLWLLNGIIFYILVFATGHWQRLVPTSWDVFPSAVSVLIQYLSLDWPTDNAWVAYNSLQMLAYFVTVFIAAPLSFLTGLGMSPALSTKFRWISRIFGIQFARSLHFLVLLWFLLFIVMHVTLVVTTDALHNFDMMYTNTDDADSWNGFWIFAASVVVMVLLWVAATPFTYRHPRVVQRVGYALVGPVQRLFEHLDSRPGEYTEKDISPYMWHNGKYPETPEYKALYESNFADYRLQVSGLVENPVELDLEQLRRLPYHEQITQHFCIQGWSGVAKWGGVSMQTIVDLVRPTSAAKWVIFYSFAEGPDGGIYYDAQPIEQMSYHLTMLAYDMNDETLPYGHGAPLRLRNEIQLGFKLVKWIKGIEFVDDFKDVGGGEGGYNNDHEFFGYRQSI